MQVLCCVFFWKLIALGFTFGSAMLSELIFLYGVRYKLKFILFCIHPIVPVPLVENSFTTELPLNLQCWLSIYAWVYVWILSSVLLIRLSIFAPTIVLIIIGFITGCEISMFQSSNYFLPFQSYFCYSRPFEFPNEFWNQFSMSTKELLWCIFTAFWCLKQWR